MENSIENAYLTTKDNPYSFFKEYDEWNAFDEDKGYFTNALVARFVGEINSSYTVDRFDEAILEAYYKIATLMPDIYEIRYE